jgi:hypothetical protein
VMERSAAVSLSTVRGTSVLPFARAAEAPLTADRWFRRDRPEPVAAVSAPGNLGRKRGGDTGEWEPRWPYYKRIGHKPRLCPTPTYCCLRPNIEHKSCTLPGHDARRIATHPPDRSHPPSSPVHPAELWAARSRREAMPDALGRTLDESAITPATLARPALDNPPRRRLPAVPGPHRPRPVVRNRHHAIALGSPSLGARRKPDD